MRILFTLVVFALAGCTSTYHPEYHPVSVSHVVVTGSQPVVVHAPETPGVPFEFFEPMNEPR